MARTLRRFGDGPAPLAALLMLLIACGGHPAQKRRSPQAQPSARRADAGRASGAAAFDDSGVDEDAGGARPRAGATVPALPPARTGDDFVAYDPVMPSSDRIVAFAFEVPSDAVSFVLTLDPKNTPRRIDLLRLVGPDGATLFDAAGPSPQPFDPGVQSSVNDALPYSTMLPSSPETPFAAGRYLAALAVAAAPPGSDASVAIDVTWKRAPSAPTSGKLALALCFVEGAMLDATAAQGDDLLQSALGSLREIYRAANLEVDSVAYRDLAGSEAAKLVSVHDDTQLADLLGLVRAQASPADESSVNLVFVDSLEAALGQSQRGKASGLPGPGVAAFASPRGGVVLALSTLPASSSRAGELLAHETAHYLGLRHTSEYDGMRHDPIADTPECPASRATRTTSDGIHVLAAEDCADLDGSNLMFYTPPLGFTAQRELTQGQMFVLLRNPLVR